MPKLYRVTVDPAAERDLDEIEYYISLDSPARALEFVDRMWNKLESLRLFPNRYTVDSRPTETGETVRSMPFHPYRIVYAVRENEVHVLRILHGSRQNF